MQCIDFELLCDKLISKVGDLNLSILKLCSNIIEDKTELKDEKPSSKLRFSQTQNLNMKWLWKVIFRSSLHSKTHILLITNGLRKMGFPLFKALLLKYSKNAILNCSFLIKYATRQGQPHVHNKQGHHYWFLLKFLLLLKVVDMLILFDNLYFCALILLAKSVDAWFPFLACQSSKFIFWRTNIQNLNLDIWYLCHFVSFLYSSIK